MKAIVIAAIAAALTGCAVYQPQPGYAVQPAQPQDPYQWHTVDIEQPRYVGPTYYAPAPTYYYPPVSVGLNFSWSHWSDRGRYSHRPGRRHGR